MKLASLIWGWRKNTATHMGSKHTNTATNTPFQEHTILSKEGRKAKGVFDIVNGWEIGMLHFCLGNLLSSTS